MAGYGRNSNARFVLGIIGLVIFGIPATIMLLYTLVTIVTHTVYGISYGIVSLIFALLAVLSLLALISGARSKGLIARISRYNALFDPKTVLSISEISGATGYSLNQIRKDLRNLQLKRLSFDLKCDYEEDEVIRGEAAWNQYSQAKNLRLKHEAEMRESDKRMSDPGLAPIEAFRREGTDMLQRIRAANIALPGEAISLKLDNLERTIAQIIRHVEQYPGKLPETRKLMNYHLPATLKIVEKYREYENLEFKTQSVIDAQKQIEDMLDTVNEAFKKFMAKLMDSDTLDVTTDIEVLKQLFERDGLTDSKFEDPIAGEKDKVNDSNGGQQ